MTVLTDTERKFLAFGRDNGRFAIPLEAGMDDEDLAAFESLLDKGLIRLRDVCRIAVAPGMFRIFQLSQDARDMMEKHNA